MRKVIQNPIQDSPLTEPLLFGEWLRRQRRAMDLSRQALANQAGCAEITLRRIEGGSLKPSKELAAILLEEVGVPKRELDRWIPFARGISSYPEKESVTSQKKEPTNLPVALTSFIGREMEIADITTLIDKYRLVTLVGAGGVGKTRLSLKVGENLAKDFADGVWLVELALLDNPDHLPQTLASVLNVPLSTSQLVFETLINFLGDKHLLLILDNCEHLLDGCARLADTLLRRCSHLKILATSRQSMGIMGEAIYLVPTLAIPAVDSLLDALRASSSAQLFVERARLIDYNFSLTAGNAPFVAQICSRLDGIPLALELAAVRIDQFSLPEIAAQIGKSIHILTGGNRTALPRQQTIRASIDWSWNQLTDDECALMRHLSVFMGGWTLEAATAVCIGEVLPLIGSLVKKSLVVVIAQAGDVTRYGFHEVIRQYAHEKLVEANEDKTFRQRHAYYFITIAEEANEKFHSADEMFWLDHLAAELPNLRAALAFTLENEKENAARLAASLWWFWYRQGLLTEGRGWFDAILTNQRADNYWRALPLSQMSYYRQAHYGAGVLSHFQGDYKAAREFLESSLNMAMTQEDQNGIAHTQLSLGLVDMWQGNFFSAEQRARECVKLFLASGEAWECAYALNALGFLILLQGNYAEAWTMLEESLRYARVSGSKYEMVMPLINLGTLEYQQGNLEQGQRLLEESLKIGREVRDPTLTSWTMKELGHVAYLQGNYRRATELYEAVLAECRVTGFEAGIAEMLRVLGNLAVKTGASKKAQSLLHESLVLYQGQGDLRSVVYCLNSLAALAGAVANWVLAVQLLSVVNAEIMQMGIIMPHIEKIDFDQTKKTAQKLLDVKQYEAAWNEGRSLSMEQAVNLVLHTLPYYKDALFPQLGLVNVHRK